MSPLAPAFTPGQVGNRRGRCEGSEPPMAAGLAKVLAFLPQLWGTGTYPEALAPRFQGSTNPQVLPRSLADTHRVFTEDQGGSRAPGSNSRSREFGESEGR